MKKLIVMLCVLGLSNQVMAENWIVLGKDDNSTFYGDLDSRINNRAWFKEVYNKPKKFANLSNIKESLTHFDVDCSTQKLKLLSSVQYNKSGKVISSYNAPSYESDSRYIVPGTRGEIAYHFVCSL